MSNKCEWKGGEFEGCINYRASFKMYQNIDSCQDGNSKQKSAKGDTYWMFYFCPFCGVDIRKPEPEKPLIVKSGGTWVAHWKGVDYLALKPSQFGAVSRLATWDELIEKVIIIPFSEITLDDEIAKLRPMVIVTTDRVKMPSKLYGIIKDCAIIFGWHSTDVYRQNVRLVTPKELQELSE